MNITLTDLTNEELLNLKQTLVNLRGLRNNKNVESLINKEIDFFGLKHLNLSMAGNGWCYRKDVRGFLPDLMDSLYKDRNSSKKQMLKLEQEYELSKDPALEKEIARLDTLQLAIKVTLNSGYGAVTNQYFRYYDMRIGEGITISGQLASRWVARKLNEFMNKTFKSNDNDYVIYSDTDSVYLSLDQFVQQYGSDKDTTKKIEMMNKFCQEIIQPYIDKSYVELAEYMNAYEQMMKMKLEVLADSAIFYKKKKYLLNVHSSEGVLYSEPKLKVKGLSMIQSSTPEICRDSLRESIKLALMGSELDIRKFSSEFQEVFNSSSVEQISFPRGVNNLTEFWNERSIYSKGTPIHVRASLLYNHHLKRLKLDKKYPLIKNGDKIKFVYLKLPNPFYEDIIGFPSTLPKEFGLDGYIDYDTQFKKAFTNALDDLIEPMGWKLTHSASLDDFFT